MQRLLLPRRPPLCTIQQEHKEHATKRIRLVTSAVVTVQTTERVFFCARRIERERFGISIAAGGDLPRRENKGA